MSDNQSLSWTNRLQAVIPWGSSTCSKAPIYTPEEPGVIVKGKGGRVWDADGKEYIDFRNGLGPITLGHQFPAVDEAIKAQLSNGILYGHPHPLEAEVAELICELIPSAERARFLKTGGEAIAATLRIARQYTGRDHIIQIGYNGWVNSLASGGALLPGVSARSVGGVPGVVSGLHHSAPWDDIEALERLFEQYPNEIAAVVISADYGRMDAGRTFYPAVRALTQKHGALLIYDEIVTGFRIAIGGVQEYFGVLPDLSVFSKGIANGMPLSVYTGRREVMDVCDKGGGTVISSTFAGETLSLAAAKACMLTYKNEGVIDHLWKQGEKLWSGANQIFAAKGVPIELRGYWPCPVFTATSGGSSILPAFFRSAYKHGLSLYNTSYVNFSHRESEISDALDRLEQTADELIQLGSGVVSQ